jgi:hypothetical protein
MSKNSELTFGTDLMFSVSYEEGTKLLAKLNSGAARAVKVYDAEYYKDKRIPYILVAADAFSIVAEMLGLHS